MKKILLISLMVTMLSGCWETSKGQKIGNIIKLADEGYIIKTHEGTLIRGSMNNGSGSFGSEFHFTIENNDLYNIANDAMSNNKEVKIYYHTEFATLWRCESNNVFVDNIEVIN